MLLSRTQVKDAKGYAVDCRTLRLFDGHPQGRMVELTNHITADGRPLNAASRFDQIEAALKSFGYIFDGTRAAYDSTDPLSWNISQLAYTEAKMLEKFRVPVVYKDLIPVSYEAPPWADSVQAEEYTSTGKGQIVAANATDMPFADAKFGRRLIEVKGGKIGYKYNVQELIESQQLKKPLSDFRMKAAMIGYERHMQDIALRGDTVHGLYGFWNQPSSKITPAVAPTGNWDNSSTSPLAILADINLGITAVYSNSGTNALVTDIALPMDALSALNNTILSATGSGVTVPVGQSLLAYIKANNMSKLQGNIDIQFHGIVPDKDESTGNAITTAGSSLNYAGALKHSGSAITAGQVSSRVVYYAKSPEYLIMHQPLTLTFLAPQPRNDEVVVPGRYRFCPIDVRYPSTIYYQDNVLKADQQS